MVSRGSEDVDAAKPFKLRERLFRFSPLKHSPAPPHRLTARDPSDEAVGLHFASSEDWLCRRCRTRSLVCVCVSVGRYENSSAVSGAQRT